MPFDYNINEVAGGNFSDAIAKRGAISSQAGGAVTKSADGSPGAITEEASPNPRTGGTNVTGQLKSSASRDGLGQASVSTSSVSEILQGVPLYKSSGLVYDQLNQVLSGDLQAVLNTAGGVTGVLGTGRGRFSPGDILTQQGFTDGKLNFSTDPDSDTTGDPFSSGAGAVGDGNGPLDLLKNNPNATDNGDGTWTYAHPKRETTIELTLWGGTIFNTQFLAKWMKLHEEAKKVGIDIVGSAWRSYERQVELRKEHCGTSRFAIYEMKSSQCSPPTATPGNSNHEDGNAIDVDSGASTSGWFDWLASNAGNFGVKNLPSESWHWSIDGT